MAQSYKTNRRITLPVLSRFVMALLFWILHTFPVLGQKPASKAKQNNRHAEIFPHYEYRFLVPEDQGNELWDYLLENFIADKDDKKALAAQIEEEHLTDLYFDTPGKALFRQNLALRQRLFISADGRKQYLQLLIPPPRDSASGYEVKFRHNKRPDRGAAFTSHPVLKLLRAKDRPILDSLFKPFRINSVNLETVLEINQDRRQIEVRNKGNDWITLTLTSLQMQTPAHTRIQLQILADPKALAAARPAMRRNLINATNALAKKLTNQFPKLRRDIRQEYVVMEQLHNTPSRQRVSAKIIFGASILALVLAVIIIRQLRKKPLQAFD